MDIGIENLTALGPENKNIPKKNNNKKEISVPKNCAVKKCSLISMIINFLQRKSWKRRKSNQYIYFSVLSM